MLTLKSQSSLPDLQLTPGTYEEFTVMILYKLGTGTFNDNANLMLIPGSLVIS